MSGTIRPIWAYAFVLEIGTVTNSSHVLGFTKAAANSIEKGIFDLFIISIIIYIYWFIYNIYLSNYLYYRNIYSV